jgi:sigma-B regulation protein RsbU (phosphoserine phosphatase)
MAAGLVMAIANATLKTALDLDPEPSHVLKLLNRTLFRTGTRRTFMTVFYALLTPATGELVTINAGHPFPLLRRADGRLEELGQGCLPLGVRPELAPAPQVTNLAPGDLLLLYTDGVTEAETSEAAQFGTKRLEQSILEMRGQPARKVVEHVIKRVAEFTKGAPQSDDITCVAVVRRATGETG